MYVMAAWVAAAAWLAGFGAAEAAGRFPRRAATGGPPAGMGCQSGDHGC